MLKKLITAESGVVIPECKEYTAHKPIVTGPECRELVFPVKMHTGAPAEILVKAGDQVKAGTLIGKGAHYISANIHSSVSGRVKRIEERPSFRGLSLCAVIENNGKYEEERLKPLEEGISSEQFFERITTGGITGKGGAGFPSHVKLAPSLNGHRYLLVNGAECEPYSTTDHLIMLEYTAEIVRVVNFLHDLFKIEKTVVAIEENKPDAIECFKNEVKKKNYHHIQIKKVKSRYPQGDQGVLLKTALNMEIPDGKYPSDIGVVLSNVSTFKAIHDVVFLGGPLLERVVTVTGPVIGNPQNVMVKIGTPVQALIDFCGGFTAEAGKYINGGPMMGMPFSDPAIPVVKDTTTLLFLGKDACQAKPEKPCIRCAKCIDVCPVDLQPILISNAYRAGRFDLCRVLKTQSCIRCGCCTYVCPSKISLLEDIKAGINALENDV